MYINTSLSEKELVKDLLLSEKELATFYNNAVLECNCPILRQLFSNCLTSTQDTHYLLNNALEKRGWNRVNTANEFEIENTIAKFSQSYK